jgi:hypothetical protein
VPVLSAAMPPAEDQQLISLLPVTDASDSANLSHNCA